MLLKALEIQGFKSFPDNTKITFDEGITAVVGPNGSGKSNISDAIRWVMGETSVKQLRGGGKMENVIFGGTQTRKAMGFVSVKLVVDNTDRRIDVDNDEVTIGRKYYRSGDSEYSVNGQSVRLKDVYEMLLDTGLGRDGYSIIGQGRISEIVGAKSAERREIFEEASGIARYRYRKNEAERRLAHTEENLIRLRDILAELEARVVPLEKESEKAKKFLQLSSEKKKLEVTLWVDTVQTTHEQLRVQQRNVEIAQADYDECGKQIDDIYEGTQEIRSEIEHIIVQIEAKNAGIHSFQEEVSGNASTIAVLKNNIEHNLESIANLKEQILQSGDVKGEIEAELDLHKRAIEQTEILQEKAENEIKKLEEKLKFIQEKSLATGEKRGKLQASLAKMTDDVTVLRVQKATAQSAKEAAGSRIEQQEDAQQKVLENVQKLNEQQAEVANFLSETIGGLQRLENMKSGIEMKLSSRQKALEEATEQAQNIARNGENAKQRLAVLHDLEKSLDGFGHSVKTVIKTAREGRLRGIIGPVSSILNVKKGYEIAIETALGYSLQNVVVESETDAKAAMEFLKKTNAGRATFLPLNTVKAQFMDEGKLPQGAISAKKLVEYNTKYENIVSSLLARIVVVEDINEASSAARHLEYRNRIVTKDGQVINAGGSFTGGSVSRSAGLFSRKKEMEELAEKIETFSQKHRQAQQQFAKIKTEVDALSAESTAVASEAITAGGDKIRCESEMAQIQQALNVAQKNAVLAKEEMQQMKNQFLQNEEKENLATETQENLANEIKNLSAKLSEIAGDDDGFLTQREEISNGLSKERLAALGYERDAILHKQNIETLKSKTGEGEARRLLLLADIERFGAQNAEHEQNIRQADEKAVLAKEKTGMFETEIKQLTAKRLEKEGLITGQTTKERSILAQREELGRQIARLTEQKATLEQKYDGTIAQLWDEYELSVSEARTLCVEFTSVNDLRRRVVELRGKIRALGNVNVGAIEEFAQVSERYNFLNKQVNDVEKSKTELEKMIEQLSLEMTEMFSKSFEAINVNFARIFKELFGGGQGQLSLAQPENLLESGIDIEVAPPGKIIKDLAALSGGEQALVAICIYFAILAVNPAPFCVLDEIEAALDDANVIRFAQYLRRITHKTQFIVITHRRGTMEEADVLYGVTMQDNGISKLLRLDVAQVDASLVQ